MEGSFVGFCPRCRNKVRSPYVEGGKHVAKVKTRLGRREYVTEICGGVIISGDMKEAWRLQEAAGFVLGSRGVRDRYGRSPFAEGRQGDDAS